LGNHITYWFSFSSRSL